jgi:septin family protein
VIPVVAKADTMTDEELATFRHEVRRLPDIHYCSASMHPLDDKAKLLTSCLTE